jgi:hypothetical protein
MWTVKAGIKATGMFLCIVSTHCFKIYKRNGECVLSHMPCIFQCISVHKKSKIYFLTSKLTNEKTMYQMFVFITLLQIASLFLFTNASSTNVSLSESLTERVRGRQLGHHRKLLTVDDSTIALDGQYIIVFDVPNVTAKVESLFVKEQIMYEYDNIAMKGVAVRNVTDELLSRLDGDSDVLFIAPVR